MAVAVLLPPRHNPLRPHPTVVVVNSPTDLIDPLQQNTHRLRMPSAAPCRFDGAPVQLVHELTDGGFAGICNLTDDRLQFPRACS